MRLPEEISEENPEKMQKTADMEDSKFETKLFFVPASENKSLNEALHSVWMAVKTNKRASLLQALDNLRMCLKSNSGVLSEFGASFCSELFVLMMINVNEEVSEAAVKTLQDLLPLFTRCSTTPAIKQKSLSKMLMEKAIEIRDSQSPRWHEICCVWLKLMLRVFAHSKELSSINCILKVIEGGFKHANIDIRGQSFVCWRVLLEIVAEQGQLTGSRIGHLSIPLYYTTSYNNYVAKVKFSTWWFFLCYVKQQITEENAVVVTSFLKFCFEPYTSVLDGNIVSDSVTLSPGKKVVALREKVICALVYLLGPAKEAVVTLQKRCGLEMAVDTVITSNIYRESEFDVIWSCQEATLMLIDLTDIDSISIAQNLWENLVTFFTKDNTLRLLKKLIGVLDVMRIRCEKDKRVLPYMRVILDTVLKVDISSCRKRTSNQLENWTEVTNQMINLLMNENSSKVFEKEDVYRISYFLFQNVGHSRSSLKLISNIWDQIAEIDVKKINVSYLQVLLEHYTNLVFGFERFNKKVKRKCVFITEALIKKMLKWCLESYKSYSNTKDFVKDWKSLCPHFDVAPISKYRKIFTDEYKEEPKGFFPIFESLFMGDKKQPPKEDTVIPPPKTDEPFVVIPTKSFKTLMLTESQKEKMRKRSDDIPALYNDLSQSMDSMQVSESSMAAALNVSSSVIEPTPVSISKSIRMMKELSRLKTDTIEGQNAVLLPRSNRRKSNQAPPSTDAPAEQPKRILTRRSSVSTAENSPDERVLKRKLRRNSMSHERLDDIAENEKPVAREKSPSPTKIRKASIDHNYHNMKTPPSKKQTPSPSKRTRNSADSPAISNGLNFDLVAEMLRNAREEFVMHPLSNEEPESLETTKTNPILRIRDFARDNTSTQNLFSETQEEPEERPDLCNADTQVMTPEEETITESMPTSLSVECPTGESLKNTEITSPNPLTTTFVRVQEKVSNKPGHANRPIYKVKENSRVDLPSAGMSSPKFSSRAAQILSMSTGSPSSSKMETPVKRTPAKEDDVIFRFQAACPPPHATPRLSILKRKRVNLDDSTDLTSKKRRISFHDPPVTKTKEYILDEVEIAAKQQSAKILDTQHRRNLLMDSPPSPLADPAEIADNDSEWEDLDDDVIEVEPPVVMKPKRLFKKTARFKERRKSVAVVKEMMRSNDEEEIQSNGQEQATPEEATSSPELLEEVNEVKRVFSNDEDVLKYVCENLLEKNIDKIFMSASDEVKIGVFEKLIEDRVIIEKLKSMLGDFFARLYK